MTVTLLPLHQPDIPAWNSLLAEVEEVEQTGEHFNEADLLEEMDNPDIELGKDLVGAFVDSQLVGYFSVFPRSAAAADVHKVEMAGAVAPQWRGRGVGTRLAEAMLSRALAAHEERHSDLSALYSVSGPAGNAEQADLLAGIGLRPERWSFLMRADLATLSEPRPAPSGVEIVRYDESMADALLEAHNAAFLDHPNFTPWTEGEWRQWVTESRSFRPALSFVAVDLSNGRGIASYVQTNEFDAYLAATGRREAYVAKVGTLRPYRGRGVASALLRHCLHAYREAGYDEASLDVDSANPTGALGIYQGAGFAVESRLTTYALRLPAGTII